MSRIDTRIVLNDLVATNAAIVRIAGAVKSGDIVIGIGRALERESVKTLAALTPRQRRQREYPTSRRQGRPLYKDWKAITRAAVRGVQYQSVITNQAASGVPGNAGEVILWSLESGAKPHAINPHGDYLLRWRNDGIRTKFLGRTTEEGGNITDRSKITAVGGRGEFTYWAGTAATRIKHPGHRPFGMVKRTAALMDPVATRLGEIVLRSIAQSWAGHGQVTVIGS